MADTPFPLTAKTVIGYDSNGKPVNPTPDFVKLWNAAFARGGSYTALNNVELAGISNDAQAAADAAQADADAAATAASAAQTTANTANSTANTANTTANALKLPQYVTLTASGDLTNERVLTQGANISLTDAGAGSTVTVALTADITSTALDMTIQPKAPGAAEHGGTLTLKGRNAAGSAYNGGAVARVGGQGGATGYGGDISDTAGSGDYGGQITSFGGDGVSGGGGVIYTGGGASGAGALAGQVGLVGGLATDPTGIGGSAYLQAGVGGGGNGTAYIRSANGFNGIEVDDDGAQPLVALFGVGLSAQPTTAITGASFTANAGTAMNSASTAGGYTFGQVVAALQAVGLLA